MKKKKKMNMFNKVNYEMVTDTYIFLMLLLFPLIIGFNGYSDIDRAKLFFLLILTGFWLGSLLILFLLDIIKKKNSKAINKTSKFNFKISYVFAFLFLIISFVSTLCSNYKPDVFFKIGRYEGFLMTLLYVAIFFGVSLFTKPKRSFMWAMGIGVGLCSIVAFLQILDLNVLWLYPDDLSFYTYSRSFLGTIGNIDILSAYFCLTLPILFIFSLKSKNEKDRLLLFPTILGLVICLMSKVASGLLALIGCFLLTLPIAITNDKLAKKAGIGVLVIILIGCLGVFFYRGNNVEIHEISQVMHGRFDDEFGSNRGIIWKQGFKLFLENPLLGTGPGTTSKRFSIQWYRANTGITSYVDNAHNTYLGYLINIGIFGALSYILLLLSSLVIWIKKRKSNYFYLAIGSGILCYIMQDFFTLNLYFTAPFLFIMLGLLINNKGKMMSDEKQ